MQTRNKGSLFGRILRPFQTTGAGSIDIESGMIAREEGQYDRAHEIFGALAKEGNAEAQCELGRLYFDGLGVSQNFVTSLEWARKAADQNHAGGLNSVGVCYRNGLAVDADLDVAMSYFVRAAEQGSVKAMFNLGNMHDLGGELAHDPDQALSWYEKCLKADGSFALAAYRAGVLVLQGSDPDPDRAVGLLQIAADQSLADAQYTLGLVYDEGMGIPVNHAKARTYYLAAANQDHPAAQINLGNLYNEGIGGSQDHQKATEWYHRAAEMEVPAAEINMGKQYQMGWGVAKDMDEALAWYQRAANGGEPVAYLNIGLMYLNWDDIEQSDIDAALWLFKAAECGEPRAMRWMATLYDEGRGVPLNSVLALAYEQLAHDFGEATDGAAWHEFRQKLNDAEAEKALALAANWSVGMPGLRAG